LRFAAPPRPPNCRSVRRLLAVRWLALWGIVLAGAILVAGAGDAAAKRVALIVGNDTYRNVPELRRAVTDANAVGSALRSIGFKVLVAENQDRQAMSQALFKFDEMIEKGDVAFFFFAGHGFEIAGRNYLLPIDVPAATEGEEELIKDASFAVDQLIDRFNARGVQTAIFVLDACRNNPFARPGTRGLAGGGGLVPLTPPEGTFVLFSAGAKQTALDSLNDRDPDPNSVFTRNFVRNLAAPGVTLVELAKHTQSEVKEAAATVKHQQTPAYYDEIIGDFVINPKTGSEPEVQPAVARIPTPGPPVQPEAAPAPDSGQATNAPLAGFTRSNSGWTVSLSFPEPVVAIAWRLGDSGEFRETGFLDVLDQRTKRRMPNPSFELDTKTPASTIQVRTVDVAGRTAGPFPISFDPAAELVRGDRRMLEMTAGSWLSFREFNGLLLYYTQLVSFRCAIREVRIGVDTTVPNKAVPLPACDPAHPYEIPNTAQVYMKLPPTTKLVSVELTYSDGSVSQTKTFTK